VKEEAIRSEFKNPIQIGILVKDAEQVGKDLEEILGIGPWRKAIFPPEGVEGVMREYHGKAGDFTAKFYFVDLGNIELELIEPLTGENIWSDYIEKHGSSIHHIKFLVDDLAATENYLAKNDVSCIQKGASVGKNLGKIWAFYGTHDRLGFDLELMTRNPVT
jgi:methylmalonyl-CoA/ethylmalonyl-CoA epimerase